MADYKSAHLAWINSTKSFTPKYASDYRSDISYFEVMKQIYNDSICTQEIAKSFFISDKIWFQQSFKVSKEIDKEIDKLEPTANSMWFVTVGFNHATWSIKDCDKFITKVLEMEWVISAKANFELHRTNGLHPHCHFAIETKEPKSKILDKLFRPLYAKKVIFSKNFIDIKPMMEYHHNYIRMLKVEEKMECVDKDREWRKKNNIPDYEKNWSNTI